MKNEYEIPPDVVREDGNGKPTYRVITTFRKGDKISLNYKQIELISDRVKNGELHPFRIPPISIELLNRFNNGEIPTIVRVFKESTLVFQFDDGFESAQHEEWFKKLRKKNIRK